MRDISHKFNTLRYAKAEGIIHVSPDSVQRIKDRAIPKGDILEISRMAGISASKKTSEIITFCHLMPLDFAEVTYELTEDTIKVTAEVKAVWRTGVEMEALTAVSVTLLNIYDILKPIDENLLIGETRLVQKKGGKSNFTDTFKEPLKTAVLVISDSTYAGTRKDKSGLIIKEFLENQDLNVDIYEVLPDDVPMITKRLEELVDNDAMDLIFTTGGTGFGPKDFTPEATRPVLDKITPGIAEAIRRHGKDRTPFAILSRELCGLRKKSLIINLPGSSRGSKESLEALFPGLLHAFPMIWGGGHDHSGNAVMKEETVQS